MIDLSPFAGSWRKTNEAPQWIDHLDARVEGDALHVHIFGSDPSDWGERRAEAVYATPADPAKGTAFLARYDLTDANVEVEANVNLGLMVVATWVRWKHDNGRSNAFTREFFYRSEA
ncbi:MAG TPA: hypothetical protein VF618_26790 [Thermoanaerobaculia bacterium]